MNMLKLAIAVITLSSFTCLTGCSGGSGPSSANADTINASTKVPASNVLLDNSRTNLSATTMQNAIEQLAPAMNLQTSLPGTWNANFYCNESAPYSNPNGTITISADGSYSYTDSLQPGSSFTGTWSIVNGNIIKLMVVTQGFGTPGQGPYPKHFYVQKWSASHIETTGPSSILILSK